MRDPLLRCLSSLPSSTDSLFLRVRENLRQLFTAVPLFLLRRTARRFTCWNTKAHPALSVRRPFRC